jgi:hypothetical protein
MSLTCFTGRYEATHVPSRVRCIATVLRATVPSFVKNGSGVRKWGGGCTHKDTQQGDRISLLFLFFFNKENRHKLCIQRLVWATSDIYDYIF